MVIVFVRVRNIVVMNLSIATDCNSLLEHMKSTSESLLRLAQGRKVVDFPFGKCVEEHPF